jgi:hypothetical protein
MIRSGWVSSILAVRDQNNWQDQNPNSDDQTNQTFFGRYSLTIPSSSTTITFRSLFYLLVFDFDLGLSVNLVDVVECVGCAARGRTSQPISV